MDAIGDILWETLFRRFYKNKEDLLDIVIPDFNAGLVLGYFCLWITITPRNGEEMRRAKLQSWDTRLYRRSHL